ncbi:MAG: hypothetical protein ACP5H7_03215, partial [Minisyncoccia bacterium]
RLLKKSILVLKTKGPKTFIVKVFKYPINKINSWPLKLANKSAQKNPEKVIKELKLFNSSNYEEIFNFSWNFYYGLIRPMQIKEEFVELLKIFQEQNPKYIKEAIKTNPKNIILYVQLFLSSYPFLYKKILFLKRKKF